VPDPLSEIRPHTHPRQRLALEAGRVTVRAFSELNSEGLPRLVWTEWQTPCARRGGPFDFLLHSENSGPVKEPLLLDPVRMSHLTIASPSPGRSNLEKDIMNRIGKTLCLGLALLTVSSLNLAHGQDAGRTERRGRQERVDQAGDKSERQAQKSARREQASERRAEARKRVLQRLEERGFTPAELARAKEIMQARREMVRERRGAKAGKRRGQAAKTRAKRGGEGRGRARGQVGEGRGGRRGQAAERGRRGGQRAARGRRGRGGQRGMRRGRGRGARR